MDWRHACTKGVMQVEDPEQGTYMMPVAWYFAPPGAKTFFGINAFTSGVWDRDKVEPPPRLGEQPPYGYPFYDGKNIWGYVGQCRVGTDSQFANGLSAADLAAPPAALPECCAKPILGQQWFLRHNLTPPQTVVPGQVVASLWTNQGDAISAGLLSDLPGSAPEGPSFTWPPPVITSLLSTALVQYLSAPLAAQTIMAQQWRLTCGRNWTQVGAQPAAVEWTLCLINAAGVLKAELMSGSTIGPAPNLNPGARGDASIVSVAEADIEFGDYLCLEIGLTVGFFPFHSLDLTLQVVDSGTTPIPDSGGVNTSPLAVLSWPPSPPDLDMPLPGTIVPFAGPAVPAGYLLCDGSVILASSYPALFAAIGTTWGVGGAGTFALPDLRDRVLIGTSPGALSPTRPSVQPLAAAAGEETHTLVILEMPAHAHGITDPGHYHYSYSGADFALFGGATGVAPAGTAIHLAGEPQTGIASTGITVNTIGGDGAHNNMQPFAVVQWIIKF